MFCTSLVCVLVEINLCVLLDLEVDVNDLERSDLEEVDVNDLERSDLDVYLEEGIYLCQDNSAISFDILDWWKSHEMKFPILSNMAAHILAIPITTVASEATFSDGGRVIDTYRASLKLEMVQALICGGDWVRNRYISCLFSAGGCVIDTYRASLL